MKSIFTLTATCCLVLASLQVLSREQSEPVSIEAMQEIIDERAKQMVIRQEHFAHESPNSVAPENSTANDIVEKIKQLESEVVNSSLPETSSTAPDSSSASD